MNDLEDRLRADLLSATAPVDGDVDVDATLLAGQKARSSRRVAGTLLVAALTVAVGAVVWTALRVGTPLIVAPSPMDTISAVPSLPSTPQDPMSATFEASELGTSADCTAIEVTVQPTGASSTVQVTYLKGTLPLTQATYSMKPGEVWYTALDKHLMIGIVPDRAAWLNALSDSAKGVHSATRPIVGIGGTAFWFRFNEAGAFNSIRGFLWEDADGVVRDSLGSDVPSVRIALKHDDYLVYRDPGLDTFGIVPTSDDGMYSYRISELKPKDLVYGSVGSRGGSGTGGRTQFGALPPGAHDIQVDLTVAGGEWNSAALSDGWVILVAHATTKGDPEVIRTITYTDASGTVVTYHP